MRFLFIVQGDGRGHITEALSLQQTLLRHGHEVVEMLAGVSEKRTIPEYFARQAGIPVKTFKAVNFILGKEMIHTGSMEMVLLDTGRILKKAIEKQCTYIILVHNHPGGDCTPSKADITQTDRLRSALRAVEITLLDHIVVAEDSFFSFSDDSRTVMG